MNSLGIVVRFEFVRAIKKKSFWISVLAFPAIIGVVLAVSYFSSQAAHNASEQASKERFSIVVQDQSGLLSPQMLRAVDGQMIADKQQGVDLVRSGQKDAFFYYPPNVAQHKVEVYAQDAGIAKNDKYTTVALQLLKLSQQTRLSPQQIAIAQGSVATSLITYSQGQVVPGLERVIAPGAILVLFYITFVLMAGRMLASATEEKENRVIEMLLSSLEARTLVVGKILSLMLLGLVQVITVGVPAALFIWLARNYISLPSIDISKIVINPGTLLIQAVIFVCAYMLFTGILVAIGSAVPTAKEAGSFMGVAMFALFVPLYAVQAIIADPSQPLVRVFSYFPLSSPITLLIRNAVGNLSLSEAALGIGILAVSAALALWVAARTFGYGTLEYSRKLSLREIFASR